LLYALKPVDVLFVALRELDGRKVIISLIADICSLKCRALYAGIIKRQIKAPISGNNVFDYRLHIIFISYITSDRYGLVADAILVLSELNLQIEIAFTIFSNAKPVNIM
jgi:hypothetical protein